ncbi:hypothetical protein [Streptomyces sp. PTY087I2]|uniref:hypothetical protein n=1 Tax=Streptomyces sp. PTY087I2 TaxID=1819298 RepID=UPI00080B079E|nr:hypothetical protein [Streptomyces sp. PTY087I2]OCC07665.1 hypothetical protein A3Q37_06554 [Streptomyces sp. PTY087I2]
MAEVVRLPIVTDNAAPVLLTPAQARDALYGPGLDPSLVTPIWQAVVQAAAAEHGSADTWRLLLIWLALPRLTGTTFRICRRLRADRADVEAEMVLALLEGLQSDERLTADSVDGLLKAVRSRAWRLARSGAREFADDTVERLADSRGLLCDEAQGAGSIRSHQVEVTRHERVGELRAQLRFTVSPESMGRRALAALMEPAERRAVICRKHDTSREHRAPSDSRSIRAGR